jgi:uncharacterized SAM-binding protein YcdF (DUF218 family)
MTTSVEELPSPAEAERIAAYLDVHAPPAGPAAHIVFGTRLAAPAELAAQRYHEGLAPLIILTGGVNRHTGVVEAHLHRRVLLEHDVPETAIRYEDSSSTTGENVQRALPFLREALRLDLDLTAVCKWYHRRALQRLRLLLPEAQCFYAVTWEPVTIDGAKITKSEWFMSPGTAKPVLKEWRVIPERLADGTLREVERVSGAWR